MKKKMSVIKKIILSVVSVAVVIVAVYMIYNLVHYKLYLKLPARCAVIIGIVG